MIRVIIILFTNFITCTTLIGQSVNWNDYIGFGKDGIYVSLNTGIALDHVVPSGNIEYLQFDKSHQAFLSALVDFDVVDMGGPKDLGLIFRMEGQFKNFHFKAIGNIGNDRHDIYELKGNYLAPTMSLLYRIPWRYKLRPYFGVGLGMVFSNIYRNTLIIDYGRSTSLTPYIVDDEPWPIYDDDFMEAITVGLMYTHRWDLNLRITNANWNYGHDEYLKLKSKSFILSFGYRL